jgi:hypothetical protein
MRRRVVSSSVINAYRKITPGISSGKCSARIKGSSGIETPDSSGEIYNGVVFRKRIYRTIDELRADRDAWLFGYNERRPASGPPVLRKDPDADLP